jgi:hypothetical protein
MTTWHWAPRGNNAAQRASTSFAYVPNSSAVRCTDDQLDRGLLRNQEPTYRPARPPPLRHLRQWEDAAELTRRNALATSPGFSTLFDVRRPATARGVDLARWGLMPHPCPPDPAAAVLVAGDTGGLPARQGHFLVGCRLLWRVEYRLAKVRTVTRCEM